MQDKGEGLIYGSIKTKIVEEKNTLLKKRKPLTF